MKKQWIALLAVLPVLAIASPELAKVESADSPLQVELRETLSSMAQLSRPIVRAPYNQYLKLTYTEELMSSTRVEHPATAINANNGQFSDLKITQYISGVTTTSNSNEPMISYDTFKEGLEVQLIPRQGKGEVYAVSYRYYLPADITKKEVEGIEMSLVNQPVLSGSFSFMAEQAKQGHPYCYFIQSSTVKRALDLCFEAL